MSRKLDIIRIAGATLAPNKQTTFRYVLDGDRTEMTGILCSNGTQVSISFLNGNDLEINSLETLLTDTLELPPNKRILTWKQDLSTCRVIVGSIINILSETQKVSLYLLLYKTSTYEK
ncbi:hypothetical protein [Aquimarina sediminis]|uniref:hypothetical protein n=1 Tax=Aquimarina sediminis TaxID=2070536 RepID=UPI000CA04A21|nr:hypothetical protein [Aquimarina sediminis]